MPALRTSLNLKSRVMWVRAFMNTYKRRVISAGGYIEGEQCAVQKLNNNLLRRASWVMIPEGIEEDVVFAQKPTSGLGDLQFTRASDGTRTNASGVVERTPWNLVTWSEMFSDVAWTKFNTTVGVNTTTAPNGTLTADTFTGDGANSVHSIFQSITLPASRNYNISVFVKKGTNNFIQVGGGAVLFGSEVYANFDLNNGTVGNKGTQTTAQIENYGNGWYRCSITGTTIAAATNTGLFAQLVTSNTSARGESNTLSTNVFLWGAQLVEGTEAKPYFMTTNRQDVPRLDYRNADGTLSSCPRLLLEPQRTNSIRNSSMVGAVAGSPGTLPTNWTVSAAAGLTQTVVGTGTENGLPYIDLRFNGTASASALRFVSETTSGIAALPNQIWSNSSYFKLVAGVLPYITLRNIYRNSGGGAISTPQLQFDLTSALTRRTFTDAAAPALTAFVQQEVLATLVIGQTFDFTIRIAAPQMELGNFASTWVPTTTAAVTRLKDVFSRSNIFTNGFITAAGGTWFVELSNNVILSRDGSGVGLGINTGTVQTIGNGFNLRRGGPTSRFSLFKITNGTGTNIYVTTSNDIKLAVKWNGATADVFENGVKVVTATDFTPTAMQNILGELLDPIYINQMWLAPTPLSDAECIQLTTL